MNTLGYKKKETEILKFSPNTRFNDPVGGQDFDYKFCKKYGLLKKWRGKRLLHVGCNSGGNSIALSQTGINVVGVDINEESIQIARRWAKEYKQNIKFYVDNIVNMKLPEKKFDAMFCSNVLEHLYLADFKRALLNLRRHLKKHSSFYISVPRGYKIPNKTHTIIFHGVNSIKRYFNGNVIEEVRHFNIYQ